MSIRRRPCELIKYHSKERGVLFIEFHSMKRTPHIFISALQTRGDPPFMHVFDLRSGLVKVPCFICSISSLLLL